MIVFEIKVVIRSYNFQYKFHNNQKYIQNLNNYLMLLVGNIYRLKQLKSTYYFIKDKNMNIFI